MMGDDKCLKITHTGSVKLSSFLKSFLFYAVICVPNMKKNITFIHKLYSSNNVSVKFLLTWFVVKDLNMRAYLIEGLNRDGVYEWSIVVLSKLIFVLATIKVSFQEWHNCLRHHSFKDPIISYLTFIYTYITYTVNKLFQFMHKSIFNHYH